MSDSPHKDSNLAGGVGDGHDPSGPVKDAKGETRGQRSNSDASGSSNDPVSISFFSLLGHPPVRRVVIVFPIQPRFLIISHLDPQTLPSSHSTSSFTPTSQAQFTYTSSLPHDGPLCHSWRTHSPSTHFTPSPSPFTTLPCLVVFASVADVVHAGYSFTRASSSIVVNCHYSTVQAWGQQSPRCAVLPHLSQTTLCLVPAWQSVDLEADRTQPAITTPDSPLPPDAPIPPAPRPSHVPVFQDFGSDDEPKADEIEFPQNPLDDPLSRLMERLGSAMIAPHNARVTTLNTDTVNNVSVQIRATSAFQYVPRLLPLADICGVAADAGTRDCLNNPVQQHVDPAADAADILRCLSPFPAMAIPPGPPLDSPHIIIEPHRSIDVRGTTMPSHRELARQREVQGQSSEENEWRRAQPGPAEQRAAFDECTHPGSYPWTRTYVEVLRRIQSQASLPLNSTALDIFWGLCEEYRYRLSDCLQQPWHGSTDHRVIPYCNPASSHWVGRRSAPPAQIPPPVGHGRLPAPRTARGAGAGSRAENRPRPYPRPGSARPGGRTSPGSQQSSCKSGSGSNSSCPPDVRPGDWRESRLFASLPRPC